MMEKSDDKDSLKEKESAYFRDWAIIIEYKQLPSLVSGVYVVPTFSSLQVWNGILLVRQGIYRSATLKFTLNIPDDYPQSCPRVSFNNTIFHPQINPLDGSIDLTRVFPKWNPDKNKIYHILKYLKRIFYRIETSYALNTEAASLFTTNRTEYIQRAYECTQQTVDTLEAVTEPSSNEKKELFRVGKWNGELEALRKQLLRGDDSADNILERIIEGKSETNITEVLSPTKWITSLINIKY